MPFPVPPGFERIEQSGTLLVVRRDLAERVKSALFPLHQAWTRITRRRFTARGRGGVVTFPLGDGLPEMMVRRYFHGGLLAGVTRDLYAGPDRAFAELAVAERAAAGGVRTPRPIGIIAVRAWGPFWRLAYMSAQVSGSEDMIHYCCRLAEYPPETAAREKRSVIREAARQVRLMHDAGIYHRDLHLKNILLRCAEVDSPEVYIIDFDRAVVGRPLQSEQRLANLKRLARSVRKVRVAAGVVTAWDKLRFLREYMRAGAPPRYDRRLFRAWARRLASAGRGRELWWTATRARRDVGGDRIGPIR